MDHRKNLPQHEPHRLSTPLTNFTEKSLRNQLGYILICGAFLGLRKNEIINSRSSWFKFDQNVPECFVQNLEKTKAQELNLDLFRIKNRKERRIPISPNVLPWLKQYVSTMEQYCIKPDYRRGKNRYRYDYKRKFNAHVKKIFPQKKIGSHTLRHSFATNLAINNTAIGFIAAYLGDSVKTTEEHYAQFLPTVRSVEALKIELNWMPNRLAA